MANDPVLIERVRGIAPIDLVEKNVFGARCWVLDGNMAFGVHDDNLLVRLGPGVDDERLRGFDPMGSGKAMKGWYLVGQDDLAEDSDITHWTDQAVAFASGLPSK